MSRSFNGSSSYLTTPTIGNVGTNLRTVAFWVRTATPATRQFLYYEGSETANGRFAVEIDGSKFKLNMFTASYAGTTTVLADTWYHITARAISGSPNAQCRLDVNGVQEGSSGGTGANTGSDAINIGRFPSGALFLNGSMAELAKWSLALAPEAVTALAKGIAPLRIFRQNIQFYFPLRGAAIADLKTGATPTENATSISDHPRVIG